MKLAGFDVETWGARDAFALQPWRMKTGRSWVTSLVAIAGGHVVDEVYRTAMREKMRAFLRYCIEHEYTIATWNGTFDLAWLIGMGLRKEVFEAKWIDGMLLYRHHKQFPTFELTHEMRKHTSFGLKAAVAEFTPEHAGYEEGVRFDASTPEEIADLRKYNRLDVEHTIRIVGILWALLTPAQQRVAQIEAQALPLTADASMRGLVIDDAHVEKLHDKLQQDTASAFVRLKLSDANVTPEKLSSPKQLGDLLNSWGLRGARFTATGAMSTDREALLALAQHDPRAKLVSDLREAQGNDAKFAVAPLESLGYNGDGRTYPVPRIYGTYTGRMTYSSTQGKGKNTVQTGVALHQWKRGKEYRKVITVPEGYTLCEFDFAGQEFRWMGVMARDNTMLSLCEPGEDAHAYMGASIHGDDYRSLVRLVKLGDADAKKLRQLGKVANLSLQYRTSAARLMSMAYVQHGISLDANMAQMIHSTYRRTYRNVPVYWRDQAKLAQSQNYIQNLIGRRVWFLPPDKRMPGTGWSYEATAINFPIQSIGADQKYLALAVMRNVLPKWRAYFYYELHDGLFFIVPTEIAAGFMKETRQVLSNLPYARAWGVELPTKFPVDAKWGTSWGDLEEFHD